MEKLTIKLKNDVGLHSHPATYFIQLANSFDCNIWVEKESQRVNAKSLLGLLSLGINRGDEISIVAHGNDEKYVVDALKKYLETNITDNEFLQQLVTDLSNNNLKK